MNKLGQVEESKVSQICVDNDYDAQVCDYAHHEWIQMLATTEKQPFWISDTDILYYENIEELKPDSAIAGWRIPEWKDEFTQCITRARIHTCLMHINPLTLASAIARYKESFNLMDDINPLPNLFAPISVPFGRLTYFYDVCGLLYNAVGGEAFSDEIKERWFHFNFGSISDRVLPLIKDGDKMAAAREMVLLNPQLGRGAWRLQEEYYANRQVIYDGKKIEDTMSQEDMELARKWNVELCCGNQEAMQFCDLYHRYVHGIDDLVDEMQDGRPTMSKEQIIDLFLQALILYNTPFFVTYRNLLFPAIIQVTNMYQDSVSWERSPKSHLRKIADVLRTCGGEVYFMVALITGGPEHMNRMSKLIRERDFLSQHDQDGNPL
jgi:hypothetical protein